MSVSKQQLVPDAPDSEARALAQTPEFMAMLREVRERARRPGGTISAEELERRRPLTPEEHAAGEALLAQWEAAEADDPTAADVEPPAAGENGRDPKVSREATHRPRKRVVG